MILDDFINDVKAVASSHNVQCGYYEEEHEISIFGLTVPLLSDMQTLCEAYYGSYDMVSPDRSWGTISIETREGLKEADQSIRNLIIKNKMETKVCLRCGRELPLESFHKSAKSKDGHQAYCKECKSEISRNKREAKTLKDMGTVTKPEFEGMCKVYTNPELAKFQPRELIAELRARGYRGELSVTLKVTV